MSIQVFVDVNFSGGASNIVDFDSAYVGDFWNDKISSIKVFAGTWDFFEHSNYQGRSLRLSPGQYPSFNNQMNDVISSFKKVTTGGSSDSLNNGVLKRVLDLTNLERSKVGLAPLSFNAKLAAAADKHSRSMAMQDFFDHRQMVERVRAEGYQYSLVGENISAGQTTPESVVTGWMNSPGHRANILNPGFRELGVGYYFLENDWGNVNYKHYWTQVFGSPQ